MPKKQITIDDLAVMVKRGFDATASKEDLHKLEIKLDAKIGGLKTEMNENFGRIEKLILADHKRRIERLETEMKDLKDLFALK